MAILPPRGWQRNCRNPEELAGLVTPCCLVINPHFTETFAQPRYRQAKSHLPEIKALHVTLCISLHLQVETLTNHPQLHDSCIRWVLQSTASMLNPIWPAEAARHMLTCSHCKEGWEDEEDGGRPHLRVGADPFRWDLFLTCCHWDHGGGGGEWPSAEGVHVRVHDCIRFCLCCNLKAEKTFPAAVALKVR